MSVRVDRPGAPILRLILGGASVTKTCSTIMEGSVCRDPLALLTETSNVAGFAKALIALARYAKNRRYWLIDPIPALEEIAAGAPLTAARLRRLDLARDALAAQLRGDDFVGQALFAGLRRQR